MPNQEPNPLSAADAAGNPAPEIDPQGDPGPFNAAPQPDAPPPDGGVHAHTAVDPDPDPFEEATQAYERQREAYGDVLSSNENAGVQGDQRTSGEDPEVEPSQADAPEAGDKTPMEILEEAGFDIQNLPDHLDEEAAFNFGRYWQSKASTAQQEIHDLRQQMEDYQAFAPVVQQIQQDPELLSVLADHMEQRQGGQPVQAPSEGAPAAQGQMQMPEPPSKPDGFDRYEAVTDPESKSAEYLEAQEKYLEDLADYNQNLVQRQQQRLQQQQMQQQQYAAQQQLLAQAQFEYGLSQSEAQDFLQWAQSDDSLNEMDAWVMAWKAKTGKLPSETPSSTKNSTDTSMNPAQQARQRQRQQPLRGGMQFPNSAGSQSNAASNQPQSDDLFTPRQQGDPVFGS